MDKLFKVAQQTSSGIQHLQLQWQLQQQLIQECQEQLPDALKKSIVFAQVNGDELVLLTSTAALASRLRLSHQQLINALNKHYPQIHKITVRIRPPILEEDKPISLHREAPNEATQAALYKLSNEINNKELQESLEKLLRAIRAQ